MSCTVIRGPCESAIWSTSGISLPTKGRGAAAGASGRYRFLDHVGREQGNDCANSGEYLRGAEAKRSGNYPEVGRTHKL